MARVQYGGGITAFKGSIGGVSFQRNSGGEIARHRVAIAGTQSESQNSIQATTFDLSQVWRQGPEDAPGLWDIFATTFGRINKFGQTKSLSGYSMFISCNSNRRLLDLSDLVYPPDHLLPDPITEANAYQGPSDHQMTLTWYPDEVAFPIMVYSTPPIPLNTQSKRGLLRFTTIVPASTAFPYELGPEWEAIHRLSIPCSVPSSFSTAVMAYTVHPNSGLISPAAFGSSPSAFA